MAELPFMASENIMMKAVKKGGDRQELHERLRACRGRSRCGHRGRFNDMIARVEADPAFGLEPRGDRGRELSPEAFTAAAPSRSPSSA